MELLTPSIQPRTNNGSYKTLIQTINALKYSRITPASVQKLPIASELILRMTSRSPKDRPTFKNIYETLTRISDTRVTKTSGCSSVFVALIFSLTLGLLVLLLLLSTESFGLAIILFQIP